jgi:hypothetical protein
MSVKNGLEILTSSHSGFLSALHALAVGRYPYLLLGFFPPCKYNITYL